MKIKGYINREILETEKRIEAQTLNRTGSPETRARMERERAVLLELKAFLNRRLADPQPEPADDLPLRFVPSNRNRGLGKTIIPT